MILSIILDKHHGNQGPAFIAEQIGRLALEGYKAGMVMWKKVVARFNELSKCRRRTAPERPARLPSWGSCPHGCGSACKKDPVSGVIGV